MDQVQLLTNGFKPADNYTGWHTTLESQRPKRIQSGERERKEESAYI